MAEEGDARAQYILGLRYLEGEGVLIDDNLGLDWITKAANQGNSDAQSRLGRYYFELSVTQERAYLEIKQDYGYHSAPPKTPDGALDFNAILNSPSPAHWENRMSAYVWFNLASAAGNTEAKSYLKEISSLMTPDDIRLAQERSSNWKAD